MTNKQLYRTLILPPPASTILLYAADGLSVWRKNLNAAGFPRTPNRADWVPMFRQLVDSEEGMETLQNLALAGMEAWKCPSSQIQCLNDAFRDITFRALSIAALQRFFDTTAEKIVFPEPVKRQPYPATQQAAPKPERETQKPSNNPPSLTTPHRPSALPKKSHPTPQ